MPLDLDAEYTIPKTFPAAFQNESSFSYHVDIESKIEKELISLIMIQPPGMVNIMERKGLNLYHPFVDRILEKHQISSYNINHSYTIIKQIQKGLLNFLVFALFLKRVSKKGYLLTDAVNEGKDLKKVNETLSFEDTALVLVCGYVVNKNNLDDLKWRYPKITFKFVHESSTKEDYQDKMTRLIQLSHTRIEPLDRDQCYHVYKYKRPLSNNQILSIFSNFFNSTVNSHCTFEKDDIKPFEQEIENFTAYFENFNELKNKVILLNSPVFEIKDLIFRLKHEGNRALILIMAIFTVDINLDKLREDKDFCANLPHHCCPKDYKAKEMFFPRCIQCIENNLSYILLNAIEAKFSNDIIIKGFQLGLVGRYYPCNHF